MNDETAQHVSTRFESFVQVYHERAVRLAWRLSGADQATAEEIAQDAFLAAHDKLATLQDPQALEKWFTQIVARKCANYRRWRSVRTRFARLFVPESVASDRTGEPAIRGRIDLAIATLSDGQREVFVLVYLEGFTLDECAALLGKAPGTVRSHLHRALKVLRRDLEEVMLELR